MPARDVEAVQRTLDRHRPPVEARPKPEAWLQAAQLLTQDVRYDYARARTMLRGLCVSGGTPRPALCERVL